MFCVEFVGASLCLHQNHSLCPCMWWWLTSVFVSQKVGLHFAQRFSTACDVGLSELIFSSKISLCNLFGFLITRPKNSISKHLRSKISKLLLFNPTC
jgi:hypothetical protein